MINKMPTISKENPSCIHCGSCVSHCPTNAITFNTSWDRLNKLLSTAASGYGPFPSNKQPKLTVYVRKN